MYVKIYSAFWLLMIAVAAVFFVTGNMTPVVLVAFGFLAFGMVFMGMISVLPSTVGHQAPTPKPAAAGSKKLDSVMTGTSNAIRKISADIAASGKVDVREPGSTDARKSRASRRGWFRGPDLDSVGAARARPLGRRPPCRGSSPRAAAVFLLIF